MQNHRTPTAQKNPTDLRTSIPPPIGDSPPPTETPATRLLRTTTSLKAEDGGRVFRLTQMSNDVGGPKSNQEMKRG